MPAAIRTRIKPLANAGLLASASLLTMLMAGEALANCTATPGSPPLNNLPTDAVVTCTGTTTGQTIILNGIGVDVIVDAGSTLSNSTITVNGPDGRVRFGSPAGAVTTLLDVTVTSPANPAVTDVRFHNVSGTNIVAQVGGQTSNLRFTSGSAITAVPGSITLTGATNNPGPGGNGVLTVEGGSSVFALGLANGSYLLTLGAGNETIGVSDSTLIAASDGLLISASAGSDLINLWGNSDLQSFGGATPSIDGGADFDRIHWRSSTAPVSYDVNVTNVEEAVFESVNATAPLIMSGSADYATVYIGGSGTTRFDDIAALGANTADVQVVSGATLQMNANATSTLNHVFTGSGTIRQTEGVNFYSGNSSGFFGTFIVDFNRAILTNENAVGTADIVNNSLLFFGDFALANDISGTGAVVKFGPGNARLSGNNTFSGGLDIQGGILDVASVGSLGTGFITSTTAGAILGSGNIADEVLANNVTGNLALVKSGAGVLDLTGTNSYAGGTLINGGAIRVDDLARLGIGQVIANAGGSLILNYNGAGQLLPTAPFLTGAGSFIKEGSGDVVISVANTFTGGTTIRAGRLGLNDGAALGTGNIQIDGGATLGIGNITLLNTITGAGTIVKTASGTAGLGGDNSGFTGTIDIQDGRIGVTDGRSLGSGTVLVGVGTTLRTDTSSVGDTTVVANLSGDGDFEKRGSNRVTLTGTNTLSHNVFVDNGTLQIEGSQNIGTANIDLTNATSVLDLATSGSTTLANNIGGLGSVVKTGSGTVSLTGANSYSGGTDIQQGAIRVTDVSFLGSGPITVQQGAALDLAIAGQQTLNQTVSGAGILRKSDQGDLTLLGNSLTGGLDIANGRVIVNSALALGSGPVTTAVDSQLVFDNVVTEVLSTPISGGGTLTKEGTGLLVLQNANSYTGGTLINAGRLGLNDGDALGSGVVLVGSAGILGVGNVVVGNAISGSGQIIKTASGAGQLLGNNSFYSGTILVQQGVLFGTSGTGFGTGTVQIDAGASLQLGATADSTLVASLTGSGTFEKLGGGTVILAGNNSAFTGGLGITGGTLQIAGGQNIGTSGVAIGSGANLRIDTALASQIDGQLYGAGSLLKTGSGTVTLTNAGNSYGGGTSIQQGALTVASPAMLGTGAVSIASGAQLNVANAGAATFGNALSGAGTLVKSGAGQLTFGNAFTLGTLNLTAGRTRLNAVGTSNVTVSSGATLDGTGRVVGTLTNNGVVAPGNSIGTLTVQGNYVHNAGSVLEIEFDAAGNIDLLAVTGNATLNGGTLRFIALGGAEGSGGTFLTTGGTLTGTFATVETVGAQLPLAVIYQPNAGLMAPSVLTARPSTFNAQALAGADVALGFIGSLPDANAIQPRGHRMWLQGFGSWGERSASGATLAYSHDTNGIAGGVTLEAAEGLSVGAAVGWASGDITLGSNGGGGEQSSVIGALHARYSGAGYALGGGVIYGDLDQSTLRNVSFSGFSASVEGDTQSTLFGGFVEGQAHLGSYAGVYFAAQARAAYIRQSQQGYSESGSSPLRLTLPGIDTSTLETQGLLSMTTNLSNEAYAAVDSPEGLDLRVDLGARYLGNLGDRTIPVTFASSSAGIVLQGDVRDRIHGIAGLGLDYTMANGAVLSLGYRGEIGATDRHTVRAGFSIAF